MDETDVSVQQTFLFAGPAKLDTFYHSPPSPHSPLSSPTAGLKDGSTERKGYNLPAPLPAAMPVSLDPMRTNLPQQITTFVGREKELAEVGRMLSGHKLVSLTGSGGTGKTRLALEAAAQRLERYPDGVWFVNLAPVADPQLVPQAFASALGVVELGPLAEQGRAFDSR
jgi:hypothetical protein